MIDVNAWIEEGEGDPCDLYVVQYRAEETIGALCDHYIDRYATKGESR